MIVSFTNQDEALDQALLSRIALEVNDVEEALECYVLSQVQLVKEASQHTLRAGGKRLRPALVALAASATQRSFDRQRSHRLGACMELIHMATLMHDDVIDHSDTRRGVSTASAVFGNTASILTGDVLLSKAMAILAEDGDLEIIRTVSRSVVDLAEGEVAELEVRGRMNLTEAEHFEILRQKTATFIEACCRVGALITDSDETIQDALGRYGYHIGIAFQLVDDLLDYRGNHQETGKPVATDFLEGCCTLPLMKYLETASTDSILSLQSKFGKDCSPSELDDLISSMKKSGAFDRAVAVAHDYVHQAQDALLVLPASAERDMLHTLANLIVSRTR